MILEGIVTTLDEMNRVNVAPMGPIVDESMSTLLLRPFTSSTTYRNLKKHGSGVFHVTDDVLLLARSAINDPGLHPETSAAKHVHGAVLRSACRWYEFQVEQLDDTGPRTRIDARVVHVGRHRDFFGFNRAKHAVLEAAILATRLHLLDRDDVLRQYAALRVPVEKTAGPDEQVAFELLERHVAEHGRTVS